MVQITNQILLLLSEPIRYEKLGGSSNGAEGSSAPQPHTPKLCSPCLGRWEGGVLAAALQWREGGRVGGREGAAAVNEARMHGILVVGGPAPVLQVLELQLIPMLILFLLEFPFLNQPSPWGK